MQDLPDLDEKPSHQDLVDTLDSLDGESNCKLWILQWLLEILDSKLSWLKKITNDDGTVTSAAAQKTEVYDLARQRLDERCSVPAGQQVITPFALAGHMITTPVTISIREKALIGDNSGHLGHRMWAASETMSTHLDYYGEHHLRHLLFDGSSPSWDKVLELGSGTGRLGLEIAAKYTTNVVLTDIDAVLPNLTHNLQTNRASIQGKRGDARAEVLDWEDTEAALSNYPERKFDVIFAVDCLYDMNQAESLSDAIYDFLKQDEDARAIVAVTIRDDYTIDVDKKFRESLKANGFISYSKRGFSAIDEFGDGDDTIVEVTVWGRNPENIS